MRHKKIFINRRGVALIVVLLIVLAVTAVALVALKISQFDGQASKAFGTNRQAQQNAHQVSLFMEDYISEHAIELFSKSNGIVYEDKIIPFTGLGENVPDDNASNRLGGDLSRPFVQLGTVSDFSYNSKTVAGFSQGDQYCSFITHVDSYSVAGNPVFMHKETDENNQTIQYYVLTELNTYIGAYKREMGVVNVEPLPCNQNVAPANAAP